MCCSSLTYSARPEFHGPFPVDELDGMAVDNASDNRSIADLPTGSVQQSITCVNRLLWLMPTITNRWLPYLRGYIDISTSPAWLK